MASVARPGRQRSDNEGEKKEEEQQVPKSDDNESGSSSTSTESEEMAQRRRQEIAEGKGPLNLKLDMNVAMLFLAKAEFLVKGKSQTEASETKFTVEPKPHRGRIRGSFAVNSSYNLRSKGMVVDVASETNADHKRIRKVEETDDYQGLVADLEEV